MAHVSEWRGLDEFVSNLEEYVSKNTETAILEDLGKIGVADSVTKIMKNETEPPSTWKTLAARRSSGRGTLVKKKGRKNRVRRISRKLGPVRQGITLMDTGLGVRRIQYRLSGQSVAIGVDGYMAYHQDGTLDGVLRARNFLKLPTDEQTVEKVFQHWEKVKK